MEDRITPLAASRLADITIVDGNLEEATPEEIDAMPIWLTMVDGEVLWHANAGIGK